MRVRPSRAEVDPAALELIARRGPEILATAKRWSSTVEDAEDAYQRGLEILLTKAPTTAEDELVPWLKTVVKHEALAVRRQRERAAPVTDDGELGEPAAPVPTHDQAERYERLRLGAEALGRLKPQEVRCLLLRAEGYSYEQICELTGFSYTKVNRCLSEGRRSFLERVAGIEGGAECDRLQPLLSALADGEAGAEDLSALRPHLKTCLTCRARLREYRAAPSRVAALVPPAVVAASGHGDGPGVLRSLVESVVGATHDKAATLGERAHAAAELATGQKLAAVAASAAALAGGGAGVEGIADRSDEPSDRPAALLERVSKEAQQPPEPAPPPVREASPAPAAPGPPPEPEPPPDPANEFAPGPTAQPTPAPAPPPSSAAGLAPGGGGTAGGGGGGEFGP